MTSSHATKSAIRERKDRTGESYSTARKNMIKVPPHPEVGINALPTAITSSEFSTVEVLPKLKMHLKKGSACAFARLAITQQWSNPGDPPLAPPAAAPRNYVCRNLLSRAGWIVLISADSSQPRYRMIEPEIRSIMAAAYHGLNLDCCEGLTWILHVELPDGTNRFVRVKSHGETDAWGDIFDVEHRYIKESWICRALEIKQFSDIEQVRTPEPNRSPAATEINSVLPAFHTNSNSEIPMTEPKTTRLENIPAGIPGRIEVEDLLEIPIPSGVILDPQGPLEVPQGPFDPNDFTEITSATSEEFDNLRSQGKMIVLNAPSPEDRALVTKAFQESVRRTTQE